MNKSRIFLTITTLTLILLVFTGCKGVVPPSPGATEDVTVISGRIKMPLTCCAPLEEISKDGGNNNDCDEVEFWPFVPNAVVELKSAAKGKCKTVLATTLTDEDGNYLFEDVKPGLYIITAYCPEEAKKGFFLKDVAEKIHGVALDAGIPDCTSTSLALVIEKINNCYNDWYHCYNKLTKIYKLVETIAEDVGKVDIDSIMNHNRFGDYCDDIDDDLVDLVCAFSCCAAPGATGGGGGPTPDPCAGHTAPYDVELDNLFATVGEVYTGTVTAKDDDGDVLSFAFAEGYTPPEGMTIDSSTGVIIWDSPTVEDICVCNAPRTVQSATCSPIQIVVSDQCDSTPAEFCIEVLPAPDPSLEVTKTATEDSFSAVGEVINYTIKVENTGNVVLTNIAVTDPGADSITGSPIGSLAPGASANVTAKHTITQDDLDAGFYTNTATATGKDPKGNDVTGSDDETVTQIRISPELSSMTRDPGQKRIRLTLKDQFGHRIPGNTLDLSLDAWKVFQEYGTASEIERTISAVNYETPGANWDIEVFVNVLEANKTLTVLYYGYDINNPVIMHYKK
jgi:uncharacterized repeat protein (TIGR01451 family)